MLQQTQVSRVLERYEPFLERFPTPASLAAATEQELLSMWQGLGYYRRARSLHKASMQIVEQFGGDVPLDAASLRKLAGVGRYTAGSMASIVGGHREPIVDGNVNRLLARLACDDGPQDASMARRMWERAAALVEASGDPGMLNEGMMELGATVCGPASPSCDACPLRDGCEAFAAGRVGEVPQPKTSGRRTVMHQHAIVVRQGSQVLLEQRPSSGLWASMWQAPTIESDRELDVDELLRRLPAGFEDLTRVESLTRTLTHRTVHIHVHTAATCVGGQAEGWVWVSDRDGPGHPLSSAARAALQAGGS
jgi:A/G-specific adenine glycosylase